MQEILDYEDEIRSEVELRLGPRYGMVNPLAGTVFPNFSFLRGASRTIRVWHPRGPDSIEIWSWGYTDKEAPRGSEGKVTVDRWSRDSARRAPSSRTTWTTGKSAPRRAVGVMSRRLDLNMQMGLGHERYDEALQATVSDFRYSESNHRSFYRRWDELMSGNGW